MTTCSSCFQDFLAKCNETITVNALLTPLTEYGWVISDKFNNKYEGSFTTDANGFWEIPVSELPDGLLTQYSGEFTLEVTDGANCKPVKFKVAGEYDCIQFNIHGGNYVKDQLGCSFACNPSATTTRLIAFEDETEVVIPWTEGLLAEFGNSPIVQVYHETAPGSGQYELTTVDISTTYTDGVLVNITVDNGGSSTGYVLIS